MQFGLSGFIWVGSFEMEHLHLDRQDGSSSVLTYLKCRYSSPADLDGAELGSALRQSGLASSVCTAFPPDRSFISDDPAARLRARDHLVAAIDLAAAMGASHLIGPHGSEWGYKQLVSPDERRRQIDLCATGLREVADHAMAAGVVLAYECLNRYEIGFINTIEEGLGAEFESVDRPSQGIMLDTFHANIEEKSLSGAVELGRLPTQLCTYRRHIQRSTRNRPPRLGRVGSRPPRNRLRRPCRYRDLQPQSGGHRRCRRLLAADRSRSRAKCSGRTTVPEREVRSELSRYRSPRRRI